ncbi:hypothetical protein BRADI_4g17467v3 [Brachypodium distachyon]|uniref:Uncharacterized protein n=1 Tax=Brachypodium distachyon TaxID=15368 RepID=A0A2K2CNG1_BRADI|nr:hypothetical protein BRADI_4g17467v3 [Brachypodium distachyon]
MEPMNTCSDCGDKCCTLTWTADLSDPSFCKTDVARAILCGMWSTWTTCNGQHHVSPLLDGNRQTHAGQRSMLMRPYSC